MGAMSMTIKLQILTGRWNAPEQPPRNTSQHDTTPSGKRWPPARKTRLCCRGGRSLLAFLKRGDSSPSMSPQVVGCTMRRTSDQFFHQGRSTTGLAHDRSDSGFHVPSSGAVSLDTPSARMMWAAILRKATDKRRAAGAAHPALDGAS